MVGRIKAAWGICRRAFGPAGVVVAAVLTAISNWSDMLLGKGVISPNTQELLFQIGITLFVVCGAAVLLRIEWEFRNLDEFFGNEHKRSLVADNIYPSRETYLTYVFEGNFGIVNRFWLAGLVNLEDQRGRHDLHVAAERGHVAIVQGILERGADPKRQDSAGITPLMAAAIGGKAKVIDLLLQHNCAINSKSTHGGSSAMFIAAAYGHTEAVRLLAQYGAEIDSVDQNNLTPLMAAIAQQKWDTAETLLVLGAAPSRVDADGANLMDYATAFQANPKILEILNGYKISPSAPAFRRKGGGFSRVGHLRVTWERESVDRK